MDESESSVVELSLSVDESESSVVELLSSVDESESSVVELLSSVDESESSVVELLSSMDESELFSWLLLEESPFNNAVGIDKSEHASELVLHVDPDWRVVPVSSQAEILSVD